ncbi:MAG: flagellar protein FliT [Deltaproteobacteria bacterium]|nr:flagellar protein FliT [Deltaproteobacteria bacterium]
MGKDNKEIILTLLNKWRDIAVKEAEALSKGDLEVLGKLTKESLHIRSRLDKLLTGIDSSDMGNDILCIMKEIHEVHTYLTNELSRGRDELSDRIGNIRKNKSSLNGYKQKKVAIPRFMSERT